MKFQDKLRELRQQRNLSQVELGRLVGVSDRTIQNYENSRRTPQTYDIIFKLASALEVPVDELVSEEDRLLVEAAERGGAKAARDISQLVGEVSAMFAGGEITTASASGSRLTDEDKDAAMRALNEAYWESKQINQKYTPKKYRK